MWNPSNNYSSSNNSNKSYSGDYSYQQLNSLYNSGVGSIQEVERPLGSSPLDTIGVKHTGVLATTESGQQYLIHKGDDYGKASNTVVVDSKHMSSNWTPIGESMKPMDGTTISNLVEKGGADYNVLKDNCWDANNRMMERDKN